MDTKLQQKLFKKYPKIFVKNKKPQTPFDTFGVECDDGWYFLIDLLCEKIQYHIDTHNSYDKEYQGGKNQIEQVKTLQMKEKFGNYRTYVSGGDRYTEGMIDFAESLSDKICEECGSNQNIGHTSGWIKTVCKNCAEKNEMKNWKPDKK